MTSHDSEPAGATDVLQQQDCLSCNACRTECPISLSAGCLQPARLVRLLNLGIRDQLLTVPEIWYCQQCHHCSAGCPMSLKPSEVVRQLRREAVAARVVSQQFLAAYEDLGRRFQRARWHLVARCIAGQDALAEVDRWEHWADEPVVAAGVTGISQDAPAEVSIFRDREPLTDQAAEPLSCMTCWECSTACPIAFEPEVFNPVRIFRLVGLGASEEVLGSPSIWLCLDCRNCTEICKQQVGGHRIIQSLQERALQLGLVPQDLRECLLKLHRALYPLFVRAVMALNVHHAR